MDGFVLKGNEKSVYTAHSLIKILSVTLASSFTVLYHLLSKVNAK